MKIKTIVPVIGITIIVGMHALADGQAGVLYTSGAVDSSQYSSKFTERCMRQRIQ